MHLRSKRLRESEGATPPRMTVSPPAIHDLPDEVLLNVFSRLNASDLCSTVAPVCSRWRRLHGDPSLYARLAFSAQHPCPPAALKMASHAAWLKTLHLSDRTDTNQILRRVALGCPRLESVALRRCSGTAVSRNVSAVCLRRLLDGCPRLRRLVLKDTFCGAESFFHSIGQLMPQLTHVNFGPSKFVTTTALANVVRHCRAVEVLKAFHFRENLVDGKLTDGVMAAFCVAFSATLTSVKIECSACSDATFLALATCRRVRKLRLDSAHNLTDRGVFALADMPSLRDLSVSYTYHTTARGWVRFFGRPAVANMTNLYLGMCEGVDDGVCDGVAKSLRALKVLWLIGEGEVSEAGHQRVLAQLPAGCKCVYSADGINLRFDNCTIP